MAVALGLGAGGARGIKPPQDRRRQAEVRGGHPLVAALLYQWVDYFSRAFRALAKAMMQVSIFACLSLHAHACVDVCYICMLMGVLSCALQVQARMLVAKDVARLRAKASNSPPTLSWPDWQVS